MLTFQKINSTKIKLGIVLSSLILSGCGADRAVPVTKPRSQLINENHVSNETVAAPYDHIYVHGDYLFVSAQDQGIQVINNENPLSPQPEFFLSIEGADDVAIDGDTFITTQYADLVVFSISEQREISRIPDLYDFLDYITLPRSTNWDWDAVRDIEEGHVVVGYKIKED